MDDIVELIMDVFLEGFLDLILEDSEIKTWVKTAFFLVIAEAVAGAVLWVAISSASIPGIIIAVLLALGFAAVAFWGHKRNWKQP